MCKNPAPKAGGVPAVMRWHIPIPPQRDQQVLTPPEAVQSTGSRVVLIGCLEAGYLPLGSLFCSCVWSQSWRPTTRMKVATAGATRAWPATVEMPKPTTVQYRAVQ